MRVVWKWISQYLYSFFGAGLIGSGWGWYHIAHRPHLRFVLTTLIICSGVFVTFHITKYLFCWAVRRFKRHRFWQEEFISFIDELFFVVALLFVIFFFTSEVLSLVYVALVGVLLFIRTQYYFSHHPGGEPWRAVNRAVFLFAGFLFALESVLQYTAHYYYILDANARFFNIVVFRSVAMTLVWLSGFAVASLMYWKLSSFVRYWALALWSLVFIGAMMIWTVNVGVLYYSGLYFSPVAIEHASGGGDVINNRAMYALVSVGIVAIILFVTVLRRVVRAHSQAPRRYWYYYTAVIVLATIGVCTGLSSFKSTPERVMARSFYEHYFGTTTVVKLDPVIEKKLEKFGLLYNLNTFAVSAHPYIFSPSSTQKLLPPTLIQHPPNIVVFFVESFSARLNNVYNNTYPGVTPHFAEFANDSHTTVFKNYFNGSTPTITGTLSELCSFLPPTGHGEIDTEGKFQNHHLLCLPEVLKKQAGFKSALYMTAVDKEYAHKDGLFTSAGIEKVYGTAELKKYISAEPLAWGYSDHQMFPVLWQFMQDAHTKGAEPFFMSVATVDTHPPFNLAKDVVPYGDGKNAVFNMFHTTDDAFGIFWNQFKQSPLYDNTIVLVVADHAAFPSKFITDLFPNEAKQLTYYDENTLMMYVPQSVLPKVVDTYSSSIDLTPTLLQMLDINIPNTFEGHSIFDDRGKYPNLLGMHELGLYINQVGADGKRTVDYTIPSAISCSKEYSPSSTPYLTLCDYKQFYEWKRTMFEEGRFWKH